MTKLYGGKVKRWSIVRIGGENGMSVLMGSFERFGYKDTRSSFIVSVNFATGEVETNNSVYVLEDFGHFYGEGMMINPTKG